METKFYQVCYGRPNTGWSVINASEDLPKSMREDFAALERGNAAASSGECVPMGKSGSPDCMLELYCRNDVLGLVRVQYQLSDNEGRPISFAHGYLFPNACALLERPDAVLRVGMENFADQKISPEEKRRLREHPGGLNRELIKRSEDIPDALSEREPYTLSGALERCGMDADTYLTWIRAVYAQILTANAQKNLYVKTDGTEEHALSLLYLTYLALPYSLRPLLSASTYLHKEQRNTRLIFCAVPPEGAPWIDPAAGETNVLDEKLTARLERRYPVISACVGYILDGKPEDYEDSEDCRDCRDCFPVMQYLLHAMGTPQSCSMREINLAHTIYRILSHKDPALKDGTLSLLRQWLQLPVEATSTKEWEFVSGCLLDVAGEWSLDLNEEILDLLAARAEDAVTEGFSKKAAQCLRKRDGAEQV